MIKKTSVSLKPFSLNLQFQRSLQPLLWSKKLKKTPLYMFPMPLSDWLHQWNLLSHSCHNKMVIMVTVHLFWTGKTEKAISFKRQNREPASCPSPVHMINRRWQWHLGWITHVRHNQWCQSPTPDRSLMKPLQCQAEFFKHRQGHLLNTLLLQLDALLLFFLLVTHY